MMVVVVSVQVHIDLFIDPLNSFDCKKISPLTLSSTAASKLDISHNIICHRSISQACCSSLLVRVYLGCDRKGRLCYLK